MMKLSQNQMRRRTFLQTMAAGVAGVATAVPGKGNAAEAVAELTSEHEKAVNRSRRILVQYDPHTAHGIDFVAWLDYRFAYMDEPGSQIDSIFWDNGRLGQVLYPSKFLDQQVDAGLQKWRDQGIDMTGRLIEETKRRGLEVFWHHRFSEVDLSTYRARGPLGKTGPLPSKSPIPIGCWRTTGGATDYGTAPCRPSASAP